MKILGLNLGYRGGVQTAIVELTGAELAMAMVGAEMAAEMDDPEEHMPRYLADGNEVNPA